MIYAEDALEQLRICLENHNIECSVRETSQKLVQVEAYINNVSIITWFDVDHQTFGFNMLNGGCKTYETIEQFENYFFTYISIYTDFIPKTKLVADKYSEDYGVQTIYDNFAGNKNNGYTAIFRVLGENSHRLRISIKEDNFFNVNLVEVESNVENKYRILGKYLYYLGENDVGELVPNQLPTIDSYADKIMNMDDISVKRVGVNTFEFTIDNFEVVTDVLFEDNEINYMIISIDGVELESGCRFRPAIDYDVSGFLNYCKELYKDLVSTDSVEDEGSDGVEGTDLSEDEENVGEIEDTETEDAIIDESSDTVSDGAVPEKAEVTQDSDETVESEDVEIDSSDDQLKAEVEEQEIDNTSQADTDEKESVVGMKLKVLKNQDVVVAVHFITENNIFSMSIDKASSLGIPVQRITEEVKEVDNSIIPMTADEKRLRVFAKDITDNAEVCQKLYQSIFD